MPRRRRTSSTAPACRSWPPPSPPAVLYRKDMSLGSAHRLVSASDLKRQRGWTETLVVTLLGAPDALCPNPHGFRQPMRFYRADRVLAAEGEEAFRRRA